MKQSRMQRSVVWVVGFFMAGMLVAGRRAHGLHVVCGRGGHGRQQRHELGECLHDHSGRH